MMLALSLAILAIPLWAHAPGTVGLVLGAFLMQFMVQGAWGIIPAHISELSPDSVRGFLPGFSYQVGALFSSFIPPIEDHLRPAGGHGYGQVLAWTALCIFVVAIAVVATGRERHGIRFGEAASAPG